MFDDKLGLIVKAVVGIIVAIFIYNTYNITKGVEKQQKEIQEAFLPKIN